MSKQCTSSHSGKAAGCVAFMIVAAAVLQGCGGNDGDAAVEEGDPAEVVVGERLFLETRFAQFFMANMVGGDVNAPLAAGDPTLDALTTPTGTIAGPFAGQSMNCRQCHVVDDVAETPGGRSLAYGDFARRSPVPARSDGATTAPRNSPALVNASLTRSAPFLLHLDGEFGTGRDLIKATLTGRNFGWLPGEEAAAAAHLANVIRSDDGTGGLAADTGGLSFATLFAGGATVPADLLLPEEFRIEVATATDAQILDAVAAIMDAYVSSLEFARDDDGDFSGSPFDAFLRKNALPLHPDAGESDLEYGRRLRGLVNALATPVFVTPADGELTLHDGQAFEFGALELQGLRAFLAEPANAPPSPAELSAGGLGNCIACHAGPAHTDFLVHNVGAAQEEHDAINGPGAFAALGVPDLASRNLAPDFYLPPTAAHPARVGVFRRPPDVLSPTFSDLGVWSVYANDDFPLVQLQLTDALASVSGLDPNTASASQFLAATIGVFKTPGLRSLGQSGPYFHHGRMDTLEDVLAHYMTFSNLARGGFVRNADAQLGNIVINGGDATAIVAYLKALNEDYN